MILFSKLKKPYKDYKKFIKQFLPYEKEELQKLILLIIDKIKERDIVIIIDQYQDELFDNNIFVPELKNIIFNKNSKIKLIISSSINNGEIRNAYLNIIFEETIKIDKDIKEKNKTNDYIPYHFVERLVDDIQVKQLVNNLNKNEDKNDNKKFIDTLTLFNYLPLYYNLLRFFKFTE